VAYQPFGGMRASQWADIRAQDKAVFRFATEDKVIAERHCKEE
jgi:malonate-semialdehyde dehydrogenase (acetylating)/methylmalonate-semialdehyde dehydrogenase